MIIILESVFISEIIFFYLARMLHFFMMEYNMMNDIVNNCQKCDIIGFTKIHFLCEHNDFFYSSQLSELRYKEKYLI